MMNLYEYLEQLKLNKEDPDYQIEDFWYGFKKSMVNFYKSCGLKVRDVELWSDELNKYKADKNYSLIEESIKEYITCYAIDVMKNGKHDENIHSPILLTNIKRWNKISNKFHFGDSSKYKNLIILFEAYCCVKRKLNKNLDPILNLFIDIDELLLTEYVHLFIISLQLEQHKMLDSIIQILGDKKTFKLLDNFYPKLTNDRDKNTSGLKLCKRYKKLYI